MSDFACTRIRRSLFIDRDIVFDIKFDDRYGLRIETSVALRKEFKELGMAFHKHRVELRFDSKAKHPAEWVALQNTVREFCDTKSTGYWTWKVHRRTLSVGPYEYQLEMDLMFENQEDMDLWLKEQGIVLRLTH